MGGIRRTEELSNAVNLTPKVKNIALLNFGLKNYECHHEALKVVYFAFNIFTVNGVSFEK